jgi:hypothetical protein
MSLRLKEVRTSGGYVHHLVRADEPRHRLDEPRAEKALCGLRPRKWIPGRRTKPFNGIGVDLGRCSRCELKREKLEEL